MLDREFLGVPGFAYPAALARFARENEIDGLLSAMDEEEDESLDEFGDVGTRGIDADELEIVYDADDGYSYSIEA